MINFHKSLKSSRLNWRFNVDSNTGHGFAIFIASFDALRASRSGTS